MARLALARLCLTALIGVASAEQRASAEQPPLRLQRRHAGGTGATTTVQAWGADSVRVRVHIGALIDVPAAQALLPTATPPPGTQAAALSASDGVSDTITAGNIAVAVGPTGLITATVDLDPNDKSDDEGSGPCSTAAQCATRCLNHGQCIAYTWTHVGVPAAMCWLKGPKAAEPGLRTHSAGHTSGICRKAPPPAPSAPFVQTGSGHVAFEGLEAGEAVYGLGEHRGSSRCDNQCVNTTLPIRDWSWEIQHSQDVHFLPNNGNAWIPFYQSNKAYGFLWNLASYGHFAIGPSAISWSSNATLQLDYWITTTAAETPATTPAYADLMKHYVAAAGPPLALPFSYTGFWQCKNRYSSQGQILEVASQYVKRGLPISVIVVDYHH